jgi:lipoprotein-anchoring transpeptidase ErfK/SrfK
MSQFHRNALLAAAVVIAGATTGLPAKAAQHDDAAATHQADLALLAGTASTAVAGSTRRMVEYSGQHTPGTIIIDNSERSLTFVMHGGKAMRYAVGIGREGFAWTGTQTITRTAEWPDWRPPAQMLARRPDLPRFMAGGRDNPLGARALYLGSTLWRIHGSNEPATIGQAVSSGCIRMMNDDVIDLHTRVRVGTRVVVVE